MGYGDLGCYGQPYIRTPHLDAMASEGMRFTQAYAGSPVSAPSRASFMTGQHTGHCEVRGNKEYWTSAPTIMYGNNKEYAVVGQHPYDPDHIILPEIMKENGYATGMFGKWAGGYEGSCSTPDKRGVDEYYGYICQFQAHLYYPNFLNRYSKALGDTGVVRVVMDENIKYPMYGPDYHKRPQYSADMIHEKAMEWLDGQDGKQPFFGVLTYTLPHAELVQPEDSILNEYKEKFNPDKSYGGSEGSRYNAITHVHAQFAGMITRLDYYVGEVLKKLKEKGLDENTLVIFSSDNGPHEEGGADPTFFGRDGKLRGLKRQCYEGGILKVDGFINHQMDPVLMKSIGVEFVRRFAATNVNKIMTIEASGIAPAIMTGYLMDLPVVFAKKKSPKTIQNALSTTVHSFTKDRDYEVVISADFLTPNDNVLFVDDFLAYGNAALGIIDLIKQSGANLVGMGFIIEKAFQNGRKKLEEQGVRVESLAIIEDLSNCCIKIKDE